MLNDLELMNILAGGLQKQADLGGADALFESNKALAVTKGEFEKWLREAYDKGAKTADDVLNYISQKGGKAQQWVTRHADEVRNKIGNDLSKFKDYLKSLGGTAQEAISAGSQAVKDKATGAWESAKKGLGDAADYAKGKWDAGNKAIADTAPWQKFTKWMGDKGLKAKGVEGGDAFLHRMGRSLAKKPLKWGSGALGAAGLLGTGLYAALSGDDSNDSALGQIGDATGEVFDSLGMEDIPDSYRGLLAAGAIASPVLGAAAGGISGNGMLRGAAQGLGLAGGSYAGYKGGKALADYLENSDALSGLGSGGKDAVRLASILGGTALGGIGGTSLAGALVPKGY
jgi:hypothetical protein